MKKMLRWWIRWKNRSVRRIWSYEKQNCLTELEIGKPCTSEPFARGQKWCSHKLQNLTPHSSQISTQANRFPHGIRKLNQTLRVILSRGTPQTPPFNWGTVELALSTFHWAAPPTVRLVWDENHQNITLSDNLLSHAILAKHLNSSVWYAKLGTKMKTNSSQLALVLSINTQTVGKIAIDCWDLISGNSWTENVARSKTKNHFSATTSVYRLSWDWNVHKRNHQIVVLLVVQTRGVG